MPATQKSRMLAIGTVLGGDELLIKTFSVTEQLGRLFQIEVELRSEKMGIDFDELVGSNATVRLEMPNGNTRYFNGYISRFVQTEQQHGFAQYRATLVPWLWFLTRTADCRIFQKKKVPDIIEEVFKGHGFKDFKLKLNASYVEWEYCVQYRETDFNFVSRLMEQEGIYYYFTHEDGAHTLVLADSISAHDPMPDYATFNYRTPSHQQADQAAEAVTQWTIEKEVQSGTFALGDFNFQTPAQPILANANVSRNHEAANFEMFDYPGEYDTASEGETYAKLRIQELQAQHEILRAQSTVRGVAAGCKFELKAHPREDQNREYLITSATLRASLGEYASGGAGAAEDFFSCDFVAIPGGQDCHYRSLRLTPKPTVQGPQTAIVVGKSGEEIETDEFGRVKVQFHWDRYGTVDENSSCWIRVSQPVAGKNWGFVAIPRVGQEVIVEFLEGDPDRPIITGRVYNATAKVPYALPDNKTISTLKTNSSKGGEGFNEMRFEDKKGSEQILLQGEKDLDIQIKNDALETIGHDRHLIIKHDQIEHVQNNRSETVDAEHKESIGKDRNLNVKGKEAKQVGDSLSLTVTGDVVEVFKAKHSEQTTGDYYLKADNVVIEGKTNVTVKVGQSYIAIEAGGIKIGTTGTLELESTGPLSAKSSAQTKIQGTQTSVSGDAMTTIKGGQVMIN